ncbi:MAG: HalOD1 output domain-containing protein [Halorientalis sp.]
MTEYTATERTSTPLEIETRPDQYDHEHVIDPAESVCTALVSAITEIEDVSSTDIEPLFRTIDPDALERLRSADAVSSVTFEYADYHVEIRNGTRLRLTETDE